MVSSVKCPHCGAMNPADSLYCDQCSLRLGSPDSPDDVGARPPGPVVSVSRPTPAAPPPAPIISLAPPAAAPPAPPLAKAPAATAAPSEQTRGAARPPVVASVPPPLPAATRRGGSPALLIGAALLAVGLFLGVAVAAVLLAGNSPAPGAAGAPGAALTSAPLADSSGNGGAASPAAADTNAPAQPASTAALAASTTRPLGADPATADADKLLAARQFDQALAAYQTVLDRDAQNPSALLGRGEALLGLERYDDAVAALTEALAVRGLDDMPTLLARAQANMGARNNKEATTDADHILALDPTSEPALLVRAWARAYSGNPEGAAADYAAALAAHSQDPAIYRARAAFYLQQHGQKAAAIADLKQALTLAPQDAGLWVELGNAYVTYEENQPSQANEALAAYDQAVKVDPKLADAYYQRARVYRDAKSDSARALADINQAIAAGPATAAMYYLRAQIEQSLGNGAAELADLDKAVEVDPKNPDPYMWRLDAFLRRQEYDRALAEISHAIDLEPTAMRYYYRSTLQVGLGHYAEGEADAREAIRLAPDQADGYAVLAQVFFEQGQYPPALDAANAAVDHATDGNRGAMLAVRGRIYVRTKALDQAASDLTAAEAADPNNGLVNVAQAELEIARKNYGAALDQIAKWDGSSEAQDFGRGFLIRAQIEALRGLPAQARADLAEAEKRALFPSERQAVDALRKQLGR